MTLGLSGRYFLEQQTNLGKVNGFIEEMMNGQKVVKVFNHEEKNIEGFRELNDALFESADKANYLVNVVGPVNQQLGNVSYVVCAIVGGALALSGATGLTLGKLASFLTFNRSFNMPINQVSQQFNSIIMAMAGAERIFEIMETPPEADEGKIRLVRAAEDEAGGAVTAAVPVRAPGVTIVDDWDGFGQALTASGTVTFEAVALDPALIKPDPARFPYATAFFQLVHLATLAGIGRAAAGAFAADRVAARLDKGWDSDVGEEGDRLSTGEKQLISFARTEWGISLANTLILLP